MAGELDRIGGVARWLSWVRLLAVPLAVAHVALTDSYPPGYERWAWVTCGVLAAGAVALFAAARRDRRTRTYAGLDAVALAFDTAVVFAFIFVFSFEPGQPLRSLFFLLVLEGALRFGVHGGIGVALVVAPLLGAAEAWRASRFDDSFELVGVLLRAGLGLLTGVVVGQLVGALVTETRRAEARAEEAERFQEELRRSADLREAADRCARALASSLVPERAFEAFSDELRTLVPFDRIALVLAEGGEARVMATAGAGDEAVLGPGTTRPRAVLDEIVRGDIVVRRDMAADARPEERELVELGLRSRLAAPLLAGSRAIGALSLSRFEPDAFRDDEVELVSVLGRLVATAVQNIRAYEAERRTVQELRRLSTLRADFVSLVSHELRSPMAAIIGSARTLQQRWRELSPEQRDAFLALIADETSRLADLVGDVLDTSLIEAGTFSYSFQDVDVGELVRESVASAGVGDSAVRVLADVQEPLPPVRADRARLLQVLTNLIENAVKHGGRGDEVEVAAYAHDGGVRIDVRDRGPGIAAEHHGLIFEKFGRVKAGGGVKQGTGLGLFIARSIAEAHGGSLEVRSAPDQGATFTLALPTGSESRRG